MWSDDWFINSLKNNFIYSVITVPGTIFIGLLFAIILNNKVYFRGLLRLIYFMPYISNIVAVSAVWMTLYHPTMGPINQFLSSIGFTNLPRWLTSPDTALLSIMIMTIWLGTGYCMIIYLAAIEGIPKQLYESAEIDGANGLRKFISITMPMISPATFFLFVTRLIWSFLVFGPINIMTQGGPAQSTTVVVYHVYRSAFSFRQMGYASAMTWVLFIIIFGITLLQWRKQRDWVTYR